MHNLQQWSSMARVWSLVKTPLRPVQSEMDFLNNIIKKKFSTPLNVLILGVTPELYQLAWPPFSKISAVDKSQGMIDAIWPGKKEDAICDNWLTFQAEPESYDVILCDGGLHLVDYPREQSQLIARLHSLLKKDGLIFFRFFLPPLKKESLADIFSDLAQQKIASMSLLKLRLLFALQSSGESGVALKSVWNELEHKFSQLKELGWSEEELATVSPYQNNETKYHLSNLSEVLDLFHQFNLLEMGNITLNCPLMIFQKKV